MSHGYFRIGATALILALAAPGRAGIGAEE